MKRKSLTDVTKKIMAGCLTAAVILTGIVVMPKEAKAEETTATEVIYDNEANIYKISDYWTKEADTRKAPVKPGYVFGGWYVAGENGKHAALKEADLENVDAISSYDDTAYAKFVPAEVLSIKTQAALGDKTTEQASSLRILSTVDSLNYQEVGFEYKLGNNGEAQTGKGDIAKITKVYSAIKPNRNADGKLYPYNEFVDVSQYFIAADVSTISSKSEEKIVYARPFWVTMDGTEVMGLARNDRIEDKRNSYTSVGINVLPQLTEEEQLATVAAGKIQVTYNSKDYEVVGSTADITEHADNGGKYLFPEMECHVNADESVGTITFVGNADIQDGKLKNLLADGLFANVRFAKKANASSDATLDFTINTEATDFCDWEEAQVDTLVVQ